jgi:coenzyme F420-dependent glucose-6-phosphate dehydrogenase
MVRPEDMLQSVRVSDSLDQHTDWLSRDLEAGVSHLYLHNVNLEQRLFIEKFGEDVIPHLIKNL